MNQELQKELLNKKFDELRLEFNGVCWKSGCGSTENLQFAHTVKTNLKGSGRGKKKRYYDIKNNKYCYALFCIIHHKEYDSNKEDKQQC